MGLEELSERGTPEHGEDTVDFVERHFYVDDDLCPVPTNAEAIDLLRRTQTLLAESNLWLRKFASNSKEFSRAFAPEDFTTAAEDVDLS